MDEDQTWEVIGMNVKAYRNIEAACSTYEASIVLGREIEERIGKIEEREQAARLGRVEAFLSAFGIETALKALIRREGGKPKNTHNLYCLYKSLDSETEKRICKKAEKAEGVIKEHRNSFEDWRYGESGKALSVDTGVLRETLKAVIETYKEKYPRPRR